MEDWLEDPLERINDNQLVVKLLRNQNGDNQIYWESFHYATRLKIEGAAYFCRLTLGAANLPHEFGTPFLGNRLVEFNAEAFFFELLAGVDTLLQEINIVYDMGFDFTDVSYSNRKFVNSLDEEIKRHIKQARSKQWFKDVYEYRNVLLPICQDKNMGVIWWFRYSSLNWFGDLYPKAE